MRYSLAFLSFIALFAVSTEAGWGSVDSIKDSVKAGVGDIKDQAKGKAADLEKEAKKKADEAKKVRLYRDGSC